MTRLTLFGLLLFWLNAAAAAAEVSPCQAGYVTDHALASATVCDHQHIGHVVLIKVIMSHY